MIRGPNAMNAQFNRRLARRPAGAGSWQMSDAQRAQIQVAATQVANAIRRPETIDAIKQVSAKLGALYGRK